MSGKTRVQTYSVLDLLCCLLSALNNCCNLLNLARCPNYSIDLALLNALLRCNRLLVFFRGEDSLDLNLVVDIFQVLYLNFNIRVPLDGEVRWIMAGVMQQWLRITRCITFTQLIVRWYYSSLSVGVRVVGLLSSLAFFEAEAMLATG